MRKQETKSPWSGLQAASASACWFLSRAQSCIPIPTRPLRGPASDTPVTPTSLSREPGPVRPPAPPSRERGAIGCRLSPNAILLSQCPSLGVNCKSMPGHPPTTTHDPPAGSEPADPSDFPLKTNRLIVANLPQRLRWWLVPRSAVGEGRGHGGVSPYTPWTHARTHQLWPGPAPLFCPRTSHGRPAAALTPSPSPAAVRLGPAAGL